MFRLRPAVLALLLAGVLSAQDPWFVFVGKAPNAQYGSSVTLAGDVDGDGHPDILIGAPIDRRTTERSGALELRSGASRALLRTWLGPGLGDELGFGADGAGDVDGDGRADILCGVLGGVGPVESFIGNARVYSGASETCLHTFIGRDHYDYYGLAVAGLGDLDGDGRADLGIGSPGDDTAGRNFGRFEIRSGVNGVVLHTMFGEKSGDQFGFFARPVGDVDGDGTSDVMIGAPGHVRPHTPTGHAGFARLHSGRSGALLMRFDGAVIDGHFGWVVANIGDLDGDGKPDLLCGAPFEDHGGIDSGTVHLFSGADGHELRALHGSQPGARFGWSAQGTGDLDGDGTPDLWISAPLETTATDGIDHGAVHLFSGRSGECLLTVYGRFPKAEFGFSIADLGAVTKDGAHELVVGARSDDLGTGAMIGTASIYRIEPARGDQGVRIVPGPATVETVDLAASAERPETVALPRRGSFLVIAGAGAVALLLLGVAFLAWRR